MLINSLSDIRALGFCIDESVEDLQELRLLFNIYSAIHATFRIDVLNKLITMDGCVFCVLTYC